MAGTIPDYPYSPSPSITPHDWPGQYGPVPTGPIPLGNPGIGGGGASPTGTAPSLQFFFNTIGKPIFRMIGKCRLPGQIIWAQGINSSGDVLTTAFCTFAAAYGAPIDVNEDVSIGRMWANGTLFYDVAQGGTLQVPSIASDVQGYLNFSVANMFSYRGDEAQLPDPEIVADKGADLTPAFRGLRYCVFPKFPLAIAHNTMPNINIEWVPSDGNRISVADVFVKLGALKGLSVQCQNIDDLCDGCVITSDKSFKQFCDQHRAIYNFQVVDQNDGSILLVRRNLAIS